MNKRWRTRLTNFEFRQNGLLDMEDIFVHVPALHPSLSGIRLAVVSDLHLKVSYPGMDQFLLCLHAARPDVICIVGDMVDAFTPSLMPLELLLREMAACAPIIAVLGNNDYVFSDILSLRNLYRNQGAALLEDEAYLYTKGDGRLRFIGLQDATAFRTHLNVQRDAATLLFETPQIPTVLLLHRAHKGPSYRNRGLILALAGHAHGGQWRLPGIGPIYSPGQGIFPKYTSGLYRIGSLPMVVSRGLGNHEMPIRIRNRPHLPIVTLINETERAKALS